jgi:hypothetical protein
MVSAADISNEPRQPNRFEKKKNIWSLPYPGLLLRAIAVRFSGDARVMHL